jgi:ComF family protein
MLHFKKISDTQKILHALKYKDRPDVAVYFGKLIGERIKNVGTFAALDALIPVPLHPKKEFLRGYNQSRKLAEGISERTSVPVDTEILKRARFAESQTRKAKMSRWESIQNGFQPTKAVRNFKHVALIDDVVTTGSTVETCVRMLQQTLPECKVSVISLAVTR